MDCSVGERRKLKVPASMGYRDIGHPGFGIPGELHTGFWQGHLLQCVSRRKPCIQSIYFMLSVHMLLQICIVSCKQHTRGHE